MNRNTTTRLSTDVCPAVFWNGKLRSWAFLLILLCAATLRIYYACNQTLLFRDSYFYLQTIQQWGEAPDFFRAVTFAQPPLYQFCAVLLVKTGMNALTAGQLLNIIAGITVVILTFMSMRILFDSPGIALCAMLLTATQPTLIRLSGEPMREMFMLMFSLASIWCFLQAWNIYSKTTTFFLALFGYVVFFLLAILSRYESISTALLIALFVFYQKIVRQKKITCRQGFLMGTWLVVSFLGLLILIAIYQNKIGHPLWVRM